jgi:hypothetical protein
MPVPEHETQPRSLVPSSVSMEDLLASCAAASAVSTPPRPPSAVATAEAGKQVPGRRAA